MWRTVVDCVRFNKKLVPIGQYVPSEDSLARFAIEGDSSETTDAETYPEVYADQDCTCYCQTCNKFATLKKGDRIPPCCSKLMEVLD